MWPYKKAKLITVTYFHGGDKIVKDTEFQNVKYKLKDRILHIKYGKIEYLYPVMNVIRVEILNDEDLAHQRVGE